MKKIRWVVFDCEGDGLDATKIYVLSYKDFEGQKRSLTKYEDIRDFFREYDTYVGHNIRRWDIPTLVRLIGIDEENSFVDTLPLSWTLNLERTKHGLDDFFEDYGIKKPKVDDWHNLALSEYIYRCEQDVEINYKLWVDLLQKLNKLYSDPSELWSYLRYLDFKMKCAYIAEENRWEFDEELCKKEIISLERIQLERLDELRRAMPKVPIVKVYKPPARPYKSDGQLSVSGQQWQERLERAGLPRSHAGPVEEISGYAEPNPNSSQQKKDWLFSLGWKPKTFKYVRQPDGSTRSIPQISEHGEVCDSVEELYDVDPRVELLGDLGVIQHRLGILRGFIRDARDGFLKAKIAGLTNTLRFKHAELVNMPKPEKKFAESIRACLIASDDEELCGSDMSSLEDRIKQHFLYPHDPEYVRELNREGYDPHLDLAKMAGVVTQTEIDLYNDKDKETVLRIKPIRSIYKNGNYASVAHIKSCEFRESPERTTLSQA